MDLEYQIQDLSWARVWYKIVNGEGEAAFTTSRKKLREPYLFYPETDMWTSEFVFFVLEKNRMLAPNGTYAEVANSGKIVGIWRGASYNKGLWEHFPHKDGSTAYDPEKISENMYNEQFYRVTGPAQALKMVGHQRVTFTLADRTVGLYYLNFYDIKGDIIPYENPVFSKGYPMPFIINSNYPNLEKISIEFENRLITMKKDGRYDEIFNRWLRH